MVVADCGEGCCDVNVGDLVIDCDSSCEEPTVVVALGKNVVALATAIKRVRASILADIPTVGRYAGKKRESGV